MNLSIRLYFINYFLFWDFKATTAPVALWIAWITSPNLPFPFRLSKIKSFRQIYFFNFFSPGNELAKGVKSDLVPLVWEESLKLIFPIFLFNCSKWSILRYKFFISSALYYLLDILSVWMPEFNYLFFIIVLLDKDLSCLLLPTPIISSPFQDNWRELYFFTIPSLPPSFFVFFLSIKTWLVNNCRSPLTSY